MSTMFVMCVRVKSLAMQDDVESPLQHTPRAPVEDDDDSRELQQKKNEMLVCLHSDLV